MKKTRNLLVLETRASEMEAAQQALLELQGEYKALVPLDAQKANEEEIQKVFACNKSVICANLDPELATKFSNRISIPAYLVPNITRSPLTIDLGGDIRRQFALIVDMYDLDIGDHVTNDSGLVEEAAKFNCGYCGYFDGSTKEAIKTIYKSPNFFVFTTIGQFIPAYLLIIPNEHVMSISQLDRARQQEFLEIVEDVQYILRLAFHSTKFLIWENGTAAGGHGKAKDSLVHAHVHVAASKMTPESIQKLSGFPLTRVPFEDLSSYGENSYLLVCSDDCYSWWINDDPELYIPRQYIRQLLAEEHGVPKVWNWRTNPFHEKRIEATDFIHTILNLHWESLPKRIQDRTQDFMSAYDA